LLSAQKWDDVQVLAVSTDSHADSNRMVRQLKEAFGVDLTIPLLEDKDARVISRYGLLNMGTSTGPRTRRFPNPTTLILDRHGRVQWRAVEESWKIRPTNDMILAAIAKVRRGEDATGITLDAFAVTDPASSSVAGPAPGATATTEGMVLIPAGTMTMGENAPLGDDAPEHEVYVDAFHMDSHEVTNRQYRRFLDDVSRSNDHSRCYPGEPRNKDHTPAYWTDARYNGDDLPVVGVDWFDAYAYARWAGKELPTEAQWERAVRHGLAGGDPRSADDANRSIGGWENAALSRDLGNAIEKLPGGTKPVGSYKADAAGLFDMRGNVEEWCRDWYDPDYSRQSPRNNPDGPQRGTFKASRGNSWHHGAGRPAQRYFHDPTDRLTYLGFRCVKPVAR
jgi:formylglycine-generating enzyme required for sulfatase activity